MFLIFILAIVLQNPSPSGRIVSQNQQSQAQPSQQPAQPNQRGTEQSPIFVKEVPTPKTEKESSQEAKDPEDKTANDRKLVDFTRDLVIVTAILGAIGCFQLMVFGLQARRLRQTVEAAADQGQAMERSIAEANRLAIAMEDTAKHLQANTKVALDSVTIGTERSAQQLRAYVCVEIGTAFYQERKKDIKFAGRSILINTGNTPAHNVRFRTQAAILPFPLPQGFVFPPLPANDAGGALLGPNRQQFITHMIDGDFVPDADVEGIKNLSGGNALYMWGIISYADVFGQAQTTTFCHLLHWNPDKSVGGVFIPGHNDGT